MKTGTRLFLVTLALGIALFAAACPKRVSIGELQANPSRYYGKSIAVAGTVRDSYGVSIPLTNIRGGVYKIDDGTGSIWVVTQDSVPQKGAQLGVKGEIQNGVNWNGKNYGLGMMEQDRRFGRR